MAFVATLLTAPAAPPSALDQAVTKASPADTAAARTEADTIIERSTAGAFFENATTTETPQVRHKASGMFCSFTRGDPRNTIAFYPVTEGGPPHGDDVSCGTWWGDDLCHDLRHSVSAAVWCRRPILGRHPRHPGELAKRVAMEGVVPGATIAGQEPPMVAAFTAERQGASRTTALVLRSIGEWSYKVRATGEANDPDVTVSATLAFGAMIPGGWEIMHQEP